MYFLIFKNDILEQQQKETITVTYTVRKVLVGKG